MKTFLIALLLATAASAETKTVLETSVYFDTGKSTLTNESTVVLDKVAAEARENTDTVLAVGMTDVRPFKASNNSKLGLARAEAVKSYLVKKGVAAGSISTSSLGESRARATKKMGESALAQDRRVDITVTRTFLPPPPPFVQRVAVPCPPTVVKEVPGPTVYVQPQKPEGWVYGPRLELSIGRGASVKGSVQGSGEVGFRVRNGRLGGDVYVSLPNGLGVEGLVYPYLGKDLHVHVNLGLVLDGRPFRAASTGDIPRNYDLTLGAGLEYRLAKLDFGTLSLVGDLRDSFPDPFYVGSHTSTVRDASGNPVYGEAGRRINVGHTFGNTFLETRFMAGAMLSY